MKIVHLLRYGQSLCQKPGTPDTWPKNHWWVDDRQAKDVTCFDCFAAMLPRKPMKNSAALPMKRTRVDHNKTPAWVDRVHALHLRRQTLEELKKGHNLRRVEVTTITYKCSCGMTLKDPAQEQG